MKHIDIFTGIGGWPLGFTWAFGKEYEPITFCEIDPFCQKVLKKHWPNVPIENDIFKMDGKNYEGQTIDIVSTSPPCQPYSHAGKRKGTKDDRAIWPQVIRFLQTLQIPPKWVCIENVRGLIGIEKGMAFRQMLSDLENIGYETQPFIIPASAINAPHRRDRIWIIAHTDKQGLQKRERKMPNRKTKISRPKFIRANRSSWNESWFEAASRLCRVDDGIPNRVDRLESIGNAIVPQISYLIGKTILEVEDDE